MAFLQLFRHVVPALAIFGIGPGPLHMLWFSVMGVFLLRGRSSPR